MDRLSALAPGEHLSASFQGDRAQYWREHAVMAGVAMALGMAVLWAIGNPHIWTGAVGGGAAIAVRGAYLASEALSMRWDLTDRRILLPQGGAVALDQIAAVNSIFSAVQLVTLAGEKHLIKYQADRDSTAAQINAARRSYPREPNP